MPVSESRPPIIESIIYSFISSFTSNIRSVGGGARFFEQSICENQPVDYWEASVNACVCGEGCTLMPSSGARPKPMRKLRPGSNQLGRAG